MINSFSSTYPSIDKFSLDIFSIASSIGVTRVSEITSYDQPFVYVFQSCRPRALHLTIDSGKGYERNQAFLSCCVEAIERYSAENIRNDISYIKFPNLPSDIQAMLLLNSVDYPIACFLGYLLFNDTSNAYYLPEELIRYDLSMNSRPSLLLYRPGTTGLGSHSSFLPACYSGLIELLERDAINSSNNKYSIDINSLPSFFDQHIEWIRRKHENFSIVYHCSPHPVHSFSIECNDQFLYGALNGMGASYSLISALENALVEAIQTSIMRISASRDDWVFASPSFGSSASTNVYPVMLWDALLLSSSNIYGSDMDSHLESINLYSLQHKFNTYYCPIRPTIDTPGIVTVKVICPWLRPLQQANMLTGVPRFLSDFSELIYV